MGLFDKIKDTASSGKVELGEGAAVLAGTAVNPLVGAGWLGGKIGSAIGKAAKNPAKPVRTSKEMLASDLATMQSDPNKLGLSDAERQKMIGDATQAARASQQAQVSQLSRDALAAQGGFQSGAFTEAQRSVNDQGDQAAAQAAVGVNELHRRLVDNEVSRIRGDLDAARERAKENTRFWLNFGINGVGAIVGAAMGNPMAPLAAAGNMVQSGNTATNLAPDATGAPTVIVNGDGSTTTTTDPYADAQMGAGVGS